MRAVRVTDGSHRRMMQRMDAPPPVIRPPASRVERLTRWAAIIVLAACVAVVWQRDRVRAAWWAHRLANSTSIDEQNHCFTMLAALRGNATPAAISLLHDPRGHIRSCGIALLETLAGDDAEAALSQLRDQVWAASDPVALAMTVAIGRSSAANAETSIIDLAEKHPSPNVRAQAAECLGIAGKSSPQILSILQRLTGDGAPITAELFAEESSRGAAAFLSSSQPTSAPARPRTVSDVAGTALSALQRAASQPKDSP